MHITRPNAKLYARHLPCTSPWVTSPETIVFLHGVAVTHAMWSKWVHVLNPHYDLILIDTRGCGQSSDVREISSWTFDDLSDDILAVADHVGVERFHAVGESTGGTAVLNLATRRLDRVASATIVSTAHRGGQIEKVRSWREHIEKNGVPAWSAEMMARRFVPGAITDTEYAWFRALQDQSRPEPLLAKGELLLGTDLTSRLGRIDCPLLIIAPDKSPFVTPDIPAEIATHVPHADLYVIPNSRHGIFFSHGTKCAEQFLIFQARPRRDA